MKKKSKIICEGEVVNIPVVYNKYSNPVQTECGLGYKTTTKHKGNMVCRIDWNNERVGFCLVVLKSDISNNCGPKIGSIIDANLPEKDLDRDGYEYYDRKIIVKNFKR